MTDGAEPATRRALTAAAERVFARRGFVGGRIHDIAAEAGVAVGSFYTHFASKQDVLVAVLAGFETGPRLDDDAAAPASRGAAVERIRQALRAHLDAFRRQAPLWIAIEQAVLADAALRPALAARRDRLDAVVAATLAGWRTAGLVDRELEPGPTALGLGAMTEQCAYQWFVLGPAPEPDDAVERLTALWARILGLARP